MALIVKSSIDILPWTEVEKQKLIEDKKEFLNKKNDKVENKKEEEKVEEKKELKNSENNEKIKEKEVNTLKEDKKKEVKK